MIRARAGAVVHAARLEFQMKRAEQRGCDALARAGELLATSEHPSTRGASPALLAETRRLRLEREAHSAAVTRSLGADCADYVAVAPWMRPLVILRGLCARAVLRHRMTRCRRELRLLHERLELEQPCTGIRRRAGRQGQADGHGPAGRHGRAEGHGPAGRHGRG